MILVVMQSSTLQCLYGIKTQNLDKDIAMKNLSTHTQIGCEGNKDTLPDLKNMLEMFPRSLLTRQQASQKQASPTKTLKHLKFT
jgi:hypothetical protein